jgi:hypothetical protein
LAALAQHGGRVWGPPPYQRGGGRLVSGEHRANGQSRPAILPSGPALGALLPRVVGFYIIPKYIKARRHRTSFTIYFRWASAGEEAFSQPGPELNPVLATQDLPETLPLRRRASPWSRSCAAPRAVRCKWTTPRRVCRRVPLRIDCSERRALSAMRRQQAISFMNQDRPANEPGGLDWRPEHGGSRHPINARAVDWFLPRPDLVRRCRCPTDLYNSQPRKS